MRPARPSVIEWACLAVGTLLVLHYAWLLDDAFVYFRYIDNWLFLGDGLTYNRGEYVEGFTSPLWLLLLSVLRATGIGYWTIVRVVGLVGFVYFAWLAVRVNRQLSPGDAPAINLPLVFLATNYAVVSYFTSGTESPLVQIAAASAALYVLEPRSRAAQLGLALAPMVRHELVLAVALAAAWSLWRERRIPWSLIVMTALPLAGWLSFRVWYYAELLPNTFYLKGGSDWAQGLRFAHDTLAPYHLYELALIAGAAVFWLRRGRAAAEPPRDSLGLPERLAMLTMGLVVAAYATKVGGSECHYRYLAFPLCLVVLAGGGLAEQVARATGSETRRVAIGVAVAGLALLSASFHSRQTLEHPILGRDRVEFVDRISDRVHYVFHPDMERLDPYGSGAPIELMDRYAAWADRPHSQRYDRVFAQRVCWMLYEAFDARALHDLGLTEPVLARVVMPSTRSGHKHGLIPLAHDLARIQQGVRGVPRPGLARAAIQAGVAAPWIRENLATIELIERKAYNRHAWLENIGLALQFPDRIETPEAR